MAVDMFLMLNGIKGDSVDHKHAGDIDVLAWSWGMSNSSDTRVGNPGAAGKVNVQDLSLTKYIDKSSPVLMLFACSGRHISNAVLAVRKAGQQPLEYLRIIMEDVLVSNIAMGGSSGEDRLTENVTLNFARVKLEYAEQRPDGLGGAPVTGGWNIVTNDRWG